MVTLVSFASGQGGVNLINLDFPIGYLNSLVSFSEVVCWVELAVAFASSL